MKKYTNSELFVLLNSSEEHSQNEYEKSYINFTQELINLYLQVSDIIYRHNIYAFIHTELVAIQMKEELLKLEKDRDKVLLLFKATMIVDYHRKVAEFQITKDGVWLKQQTDVDNQVQPKLNWTSSNRDLVELIYALYYSKSLNSGEKTLKEIVQQFEQFFGVQIKNYSHSFLRIRERMKERTYFVSKLQNTLESKMKEKDQ